jgi:hypothetical protein
VDETPSGHTEPEAQPSVHVSGFTKVTEGQHSNSSSSLLSSTDTSIGPSPSLFR